MRGEESDHVWFAPGTYYIGDPCYVIPNDEWMEYLDTWPAHENWAVGWVTGIARDYKGRKCWHDGTAYGDGSYRDNEGYEYGVDAGLIGIVPIELCEKRSLEEIETGGLGRIVKFDKRFEVYSESNSTFHFGHLEIVTDGSDYEDEEEDEEESCTRCGSYGDTYDGVCEDCRNYDEEDEE